MKNFIPLLVLAVVLNSPTGAVEWHQAIGTLKTRWAKEVSPENALPEYPRPQMVRKDWLNLNGLWDLKLGTGGDTQILVPYPIESALSGVMKHSDRMIYRRSFSVPQEWRGRRVLLHFGAVDWEAKVTVNGKEMGNHQGGYDAFHFDITAALSPGASQEITVEVYDPTNDAGKPRGKQSIVPGSIMYTPTSGIWQTVWLEPVAEAHIESLKVVTDLDAGCVRLTVKGSDGRQMTMEAVASDGGKSVAEVRGVAGGELILPIRDAKLWMPGSPHLYDLQISLMSEDRVVDTVTSYFGMRKIALGKDEKGITRLMLNGEAVFQVGPLDQGFWPDGLYTAPTDEALRFDIAETRRLGFNCTRKHIKVEPERWYYWCDKLGLMVWQDMPSINSYGGKQPIDAPQFKTELERMVVTHWNHPAIIMWVIFNESQGQHDTESLVAMTRQLDPSRLINNASGDTDKHCGDVIDRHSYPGPDSPKPEENRAAVLGEFGGLGLPVDGYTWSKSTWGYKGASSMEALNRDYEKLLVKCWELHRDPGLSAVIYTQLTDVETECNGLLTYDREIHKVSPERATAVNTGHAPPPLVLQEISPTSQREGVPWRFTTEQPAVEWNQPKFDDTAWQQGLGGFGTAGTPGAVIQTEWKSADIWLRREFEWSADPTARPVLKGHHDDEVEIYLNGIPANHSGNFTTDYEELEITPQAAASLKPGKNVISLHCHQKSGGQYVDAGIFAEVRGEK
jgi:Glycosyl hydrolases family 2, sugar binding domain/Glycosyl hydrolases family 2, TIM barrel domain/Glycosyl hydrolases family 2